MQVTALADVRLSRVPLGAICKSLGTPIELSWLLLEPDGEAILRDLAHRLRLFRSPGGQAVRPLA